LKFGQKSGNFSENNIRKISGDYYRGNNLFTFSSFCRYWRGIFRIRSGKSQKKGFFWGGGNCLDTLLLFLRKRFFFGIAIRPGNHSNLGMSENKKVVRPGMSGNTKVVREIRKMAGITSL